MLPDKNKILIVLDIDETLVHVIRSHEKFKHEYSMNLVRTGFPTVPIKFNLRPGCREFLQDLHQDFNIVLMTASHKSYADLIYAFLDPKKSLLKGMFSKDHCINYTKGRYCARS